MLVFRSVCLIAASLECGLFRLLFLVQPRSSGGDDADIRLEQNQFKESYLQPSLSSIIMVNEWSLVTKIDELGPLSKSQRVNRECSIICLNKTWLQVHIPNANATNTVFQILLCGLEHQIEWKGIHCQENSQMLLWWLFTFPIPHC